MVVMKIQSDSEIKECWKFLGIAFLVSMSSSKCFRTLVLLAFHKITERWMRYALAVQYGSKDLLIGGGGHEERRV